MSGLIAPSRTPGAVLQAIRDRRVEPVMSWSLAREIVEVLARPSIRRYGITDADVDDLVGLLGPFLPDVELAVSVRDPDDAPVVAAALAGRAEAIVTGDHDLLDDHDLRAWLAQRDIEVLTPGEALERLGG